MRTRIVLAAAYAAAQLTARPSHAQTAPEQDPSIDGPQPDEYADADPSALTEFRGALEPYGSWVDDPAFGTVWMPGADQVDATFQPYDTAGSWDYVDGDYVWVSDYPWGWVCFHYGRWAFTAGRWVWIPGRDYAGAWVSWRVGDDAFHHVGWAPMAPAWIWVGGVASVLGFSLPAPRWVSSPYDTLFSSSASWHVVTGDGAAAFATHTRGYVPATPSVASAGVTPSVPHGPPPAALGIEVSRLALPALNASELRARLFARPSTGQPLGARPPARRVVVAAPLPRATQVPQRRFAGNPRGLTPPRR